MKINKIEFLNLNSLKGYWCIDFENPEFKKYYNQFVIHGDTGSGKTTILDAITLALYGKTPRINSSSEIKYGDAVDEIITKHTDNCMASITYECRKGHFKSTFIKKRGSRIGFKVVNLDTGEESEKITTEKGPAAKTEEIIQLGYDQFCRSILLAQGKFDTFILGSEREKAEILAQMAGIDYKDIGKQIWLKGKKIIGNYQGKKKELDSIELLSEEQETLLQSELDNIPKANEKLQKQIEFNRESIIWINQLEKLSFDFDQAKKAREAFEDREKVFKEQKIVLKSAEKAAKCETVFSKYSQMMLDDEEDRKKICESEDKLKKLEEKRLQVGEEVSSAKKSFSKLNNRREEFEALWTAVRALDLKISSSKKTVQEANERKDKAEKEFIDASKKIKFLEEEIQNFESEIKKASEYLLKNGQDKALEKIIPELEGKNQQIKKAEEKLKSVKKLIQDEGKILNQNNEIKSKIDEQILELEKQLKELVSTEYLSISLILREKLEEGKACPVCGGMDHPFCKGQKKTEDLENKAGQVAAKVAEFSEQIDGLRKELKTLENEISSSVSRIDQSNKSVENESKDLESLENSVEDLLNDWKIVHKWEEPSVELKNTILLLKEKSEEYKKYSEQNESAQNQLNLKQTEKNGINLSVVENKFNQELTDFNSKKADLENLSADRIELFGEKNVDSEKKNFEFQLEELNQAVEAKKEIFDSIGKEISSVESVKRAVEERIKNRQEPMNKAKDDFKSALEKNGFASKEDFLSCRLSEDELTRLKNEEEILKVDSTKTQEALNRCRKAFEDCKALNKTDKSKESLESENSELENQKSRNSVKAGENSQILNENKQKKNEAKSIQEELSKLEESKMAWEQVQNIIGKKDGDDFQVFVEALAFKNLLKKANVYMRMITKKYTLVQVPGRVEFKIHDDFFPDPSEDRSVFNMSGGERFIISLSLALGIAELASKNVKVDCLFLDEGFGTLSGKPLYESINALKALQLSGKMLGIITHVPEVISSFDLLLEAGPCRKNNGYTQLEGAGITHAENWTGK